MSPEEKLSMWLKDKGIERKDAAIKLGYKLSAFNNYFRRSISTNFIDKLVEVYPEIDLNWLFKKDMSAKNIEYERVESKEEIILKLERYLSKLKQK